MVQTLSRSYMLSNRFEEARALAADLPNARKSYQDFLAIWKDADPDIPILVQAMREYAKLGSG